MYPTKKQYEDWVRERSHRIQEMRVKILKPGEVYWANETEQPTVRIYTIKCACGYTTRSEDGAEVVAHAAEHIKGEKSC